MMTAGGRPRRGNLIPGANSTITRAALGANSTMLQVPPGRQALKTVIDDRERRRLGIETEVDLRAVVADEERRCQERKRRGCGRTRSGG